MQKKIWKWTMVQLRKNGNNETKKKREGQKNARQKIYKPKWEINGVPSNSLSLTKIKYSFLVNREPNRRKSLSQRGKGIEPKRSEKWKRKRRERVFRGRRQT